MKKVIIIGANGSLAKYVIEELKKHSDVNLTLFLRNRRNLDAPDAEGCEVVEGDVMDYNKLKQAIEGKDIVYVNLAGNLQAMATNIVKAMKETGVNRIIAISSIGIYNQPLKPVLIPYRQLADVIEASGLDYTILRPDWFTNANEVNYELTKKGEPEKGTAVSRKSVANFIGLMVANTSFHNKQNLGISKPN